MATTPTFGTAKVRKAALEEALANAQKKARTGDKSAKIVVESLEKAIAVIAKEIDRAQPLKVRPPGPSRNIPSGLPPDSPRTDKPTSPMALTSGARETFLTDEQKQRAIEQMGVFPERAPEAPTSGVATTLGGLEAFSGFPGAALGVVGEVGGKILDITPEDIGRRKPEPSAGVAPASPPPGGEPPLGDPATPPAEAEVMGTGEIEGPLQPARLGETTSLTQAASDKETMLHSPALAAFEALLEAPDEKFVGAAFSPLESAMLGLLAGLRGSEAALPYIQMRRQDARFAFDAARRAKTEQLGGLFNMAQIAETNRRFKLGQEQQVRLTKMQIAGARDVALLRATGRQAQALQLSATVISDFGSAIDATASIRDFRAKFIADGQPGGRFLKAIPKFMWTDAQLETAADLEANQQPILSKFLGAVRSVPELEGISTFIAPFTSADREILNSTAAMERIGISAIRSEGRALQLQGFDVSGIEQLLLEKGFSGFGVSAPSAGVPLPPGLNIDPFNVLADEGAF